MRLPWAQRLSPDITIRDDCDADAHATTRNGERCITEHPGLCRGCGVGVMRKYRVADVIFSLKQRLLFDVNYRTSKIPKSFLFCTILLAQEVSIVTTWVSTHLDKKRGAHSVAITIALSIPICGE